jgi:uncharacterized protein YndB with AHSA1/START domain
MEKLTYKIMINAPREKVWDTMLNDETYRKWTDVFSPGSHYVGDWNQGSKIHFLGPDEKGIMSGMVSRIKENRKYEFISIEHLGVVADGKEDTTSDSVKAWAGGRENYTFRELPPDRGGQNGTTEVLVELDSPEEFKDMFENIWPKALQKLKELAEG